LPKEGFHQPRKANTLQVKTHCNGDDLSEENKRASITIELVGSLLLVVDGNKLFGISLLKIYYLPNFSMRLKHGKLATSSK
jgi:hypothetical protein